MAKDILIVEDDPAQARLLARIVEREGYAPRCVGNGREALKEVRRAAPRAIVLDLLLPGRSGEEVLADLKADSETRKIPVIAISAFYRGGQTSTRLKQAGASAFLHKPFRAEDLLDELRGLLDPDDDTSGTTSRIDLTAIAPSEVIWGAVEREFSGALHFARGKRHKILLLERGQLVAVRSNLVEETLGRRLLRKGRIDAEAESRSADCARRGQLQGEALVSMGVVSAAEIDEELELQAGDKLLDLFTWTAGLAWEEPGVRSLSMSTRVEGWSPERVIQSGAHLINRRRLNEILEPYREHCAMADEDETLTGVDTSLRGRLERGVRVGEVEGDDAATLYAAWRVGKLRFAEPGDGKGARDAASSASLARKLSVLADLKKQQDLFQVLELDPGASPEQVRAAYARLAPEYASERYADQPQRVQSLAAALRSRLELSLSILSDPLAAEAYTTRAQAWLNGEIERDALTRQVCAQARLRRAEGLLQQRQLSEAQRCLDAALELNPEDPEALALQAWVSFLGARDDAREKSQAIERLRKARALAPDAVTPLFYLALVCKLSGRPQQAIAGLRRVLQLSPGHVEAARELRLLQSRERSAR